MKGKGEKKWKFATLPQRVFNGQLYTRRFHFGTKKSAKEYARRLRKSGLLVRIVPHKGVYTVYSRTGG